MFWLFCQFALFFTEPNAYPPQIISPIQSRSGRPEIHGIIGEDQTIVKLQHPLLATDADKIGGACMKNFTQCYCEENM